MRKNTWYAVYHQRELDYLARSYQPGYFFMFMGRKPLTEYLRVDGLNKMLADLNFGQDFAIQRLGVDQVTYDSAADLWDFLAHVRIRGNLRFDDYLSWQAAADRDLFVLNSQGVNVYDGAAYQEVMKFVRAAVPYTDIPRLGDVTTLAGSTLDFRLSFTWHGSGALIAGKSFSALQGKLILPDGSGGGATAGQCRYNAATDTFEIHDGIMWNAH